MAEAQSADRKVDSRGKKPGNLLRPPATIVVEADSGVEIRARWH